VEVVQDIQDFENREPNQTDPGRMDKDMSELDEVLKDAKEQYGTVGAWAYTVKQAAAELAALRARIAELEAKQVKVDNIGQPILTSICDFCNAITCAGCPVGGRVRCDGGDETFTPDRSIDE